MPDKRLGILEQEAQVTRQMYELCAAGYGSRTIARLLQEKGIRKRNGTCFSDSDIRRMIRNPINKGTVVMNRRHFDFDTKQMVKNPNEDQYVYENRIPAIVSKELWERANREIDKRAGKKTVGINPGKHILSGKLVCGLCGAPFYRTTRKRKHDQICQWKCRTYLEQGRTKPGKEGGCDNIHLEENGLFSFLANSIFTNSSCCEAEELLAKIFLKLLKECLQETRQKEQAHSQQYHQKLRQQQSLLLEKYLEGLIDESLYKEKQLDLQSKIQEQNIRNIPKENSHRSFPTPEERLETIRQFLLQNQCISKACVFGMLETVEKITVFPERLEVLQKGKLGQTIFLCELCRICYTTD